MKTTFQAYVEGLRDACQTQASCLAEDSDLPCIYTKQDWMEAKVEAFNRVLDQIKAWKDRPIQYLLIDQSHASVQVAAFPDPDTARKEMKERIREMVPWISDTLLKVASYRDQNCVWDLFHGTVWTEDGNVARHWQILCQTGDGTIR